MKVLIIEGSQSPPSFIVNLIDGLLKTGVELALLGRSRNVHFVPKYAEGFTRIVTDYTSFRILRILRDLIFLAIRKPGALMDSIKLTRQRKKLSQRMLDVLLYGKIYAYNPDIIHFQWAAHLERYAPLILSKRFKIIVSLRGRHINVSPIVDRAIASRYASLFPYINAFHGVSKAIIQEAEKYGAHKKNAFLIYSIIKEHFLLNYEKHRNPNRRTLSMVSVGRFHWKKGYITAIEAVNALKKRGIEVQYTILAGADVPEEILFSVDQLGLNHQVKFINRISHSEMPEFMKQHSLLLLPSIEEGIANVVLEAMAVGLPVISTDAGGMGEVVIHEKTGWLVSVGDPEDIAKIVFQYLDISEEKLMNIRQNAYNLVLEQHNEVNQVNRFKELYQNTLHSET